TEAARAEPAREEQREAGGERRARDLCEESEPGVPTYRVAPAPIVFRRGWIAHALRSRDQGSRFTAKALRGTSRRNSALCANARRRHSGDAAYPAQRS